MGFKRRKERSNVMGSLNVVAVATKDDIEGAITAHLVEDDIPTPPVPVPSPDMLWTAGAAQELPKELPSGFVVDLSVLKPEVRYLVFFLTTAEEHE